MRLSPKLLKQHIGFHFKKHWIFQGQKKVYDTGSAELLQQKGITVIDANEFVREKKEHAKLQVIGTTDPPIPWDKNHPEWKETPCYVYSEDHVLLEGLAQAQILTKSISMSDMLPEPIEAAAQTEHPMEIHEVVKKIILYSNIFDCEQKKLPKIKDPERPAYNFPRILGVTDARRNILITNKLLDLLERTSGSSKDKLVTRDGEVITSLEKDGDLLQFQFSSNILLTSNKPLKPVEHDLDSTQEYKLPDLYPVNHKVSIPKKNFYNFESSYPLNDDCKWFHPHTSILHFNATKVHNIFETPVTENQILSRSLLHNFTVAAAYAKARYGKDVTLLPEPATVQCIQTDGCNFIFSVLQLNNLDMNSTNGVKNVWFKSPSIPLFKTCKYLEGRPILEDYNPVVYNYLSAMYRSQ